VGTITSFDVRSIENPAVPLSAAAIDEDYGLTDSHSVTGVKVSRNRVLGYSAVWRAVNLIAGDVGRLPVGVFRRGDDGRKPDGGHPAAKVLRRPNEYMTPVVFRRTIQAHALLDGNGYAAVIRGVDAEPLELLPLDPCRTWPVRVGGCLWYVSEAGEPIPGKRRRRGLVKLLGSDVIHIPGLGYDGLCGYSVVRVLRETFGTALAARDYGSRFFANDAQPGLAIEVPAGMKPEAIDKVRTSWAAIHQGLKKAHATAILREGMKLVPYGRTNARDAQLLENRAFDAREIANVFGVPAHKLGDPSKTAYNSLESENQSYLDDTLDGWLTVWEQELGVKLLSEFEKLTDSHAIEFNRRALLRTNLAERGTYYSQALNAGWMNPDEIREEEGRNPIPDGSGKAYTRPVNVGPVAGPAAAPPEPAADPAPAPADAPAAAESGSATGAVQAAADSGGVQDTALNGAQITSLLLVADAVAQKRYPAAAAEAIVQAAFPLMGRDLIRTFINALATYQPPAEPAATPAPTPAAEPTPTPDPAPLRAALAAVWRETVGRMVRRLATHAERLAKRPHELRSYLAKPIQDEHVGVIADALRPPIEAFRAAGGFRFSEPEACAGEIVREFSARVGREIGKASDLAAAVRSVAAALEAEQTAGV
jgi:HK97 family phage portal protein